MQLLENSSHGMMRRGKGFLGSARGTTEAGDPAWKQNQTALVRDDPPEAFYILNTESRIGASAAGLGHTGKKWQVVEGMGQTMVKILNHGCQEGQRRCNAHGIKKMKVLESWRSLPKAGKVELDCSQRIMEFKISEAAT